MASRALSGRYMYRVLVSPEFYGARADATTAARLRHARRAPAHAWQLAFERGDHHPALSSGFYGAVCRGGDSAPRLRLGPCRGGSRSWCRGWWAKAADPDVAAAGAKAAALRAVAAGAKARAHAADGAQAASLGGCCRCGASSPGLWGPIGFLPKSRSVGEPDRPSHFGRP